MIALTWALVRFSRFRATIVTSGSFVLQNVWQCIGLCSCKFAADNPHHSVIRRCTAGTTICINTY
eukprot:3304713-Amphidinium_carterae.1